MVRINSALLTHGSFRGKSNCPKYFSDYLTDCNMYKRITLEHSANMQNFLMKLFIRSAFDLNAKATTQ